MRSTLSAYLNKAIFAIVILVVALTPLLFNSLTTEFYETPKLILIVVSVLTLIVLWSLSWVLQGKVVFTRTSLDVPLILLLIVVLVSTFLSDSRFAAIFGNFPRIHGSAIAWTAYILLYFIIVSNIKTVNHVRILLYSLLGSALVAAVITLMSYFNAYLPLPFAKLQSFTPTGSSFSTAALLTLLLPLLFSQIIRPTKFLTQPIALVLATIFGLTIALVGTLWIQLIALFSVLLVILYHKKEEVLKSLPFWGIPLLICLVVYALAFIPMAKKNPFQEKHNSFPYEVSLPFTTSWKISGSSFINSPFFGTGPSTYLYNFTAFKPIEFNSTKYWNLRFDNAFNEYLQILGTLGGLGFLAILFLSIMILSFAWKGLFNKENNIVLGLSISAIVFILLMLVHTTSPVLIVAAFAVLASLIALNKSQGKVEELSLGIKASKLKDVPMFGGDSMENLMVGDILPVILFIPIFILALIAFWNTYLVVSADVYHRMALNAASSKGLDTYNYLVKAENLNPKIDLYRTDLAQTNFALANAIAVAKGPNESSPGGSLTDQDKQNIQQLLSQSINEAKVAVTLSPKSAQNWEILASIYRQISGVAQNALQYSLDGYGRAISQDPLNPLLRLNVGGIYYSVKNYDLAIRFFDDAVKLKPDYANAYYNLSVALRDKGSLQESQAVAERVVSLLSTDTSNPDYKTASDFLADLKARIATGSAQQASTVPPAAQQNGALQNKELPQVQLDQLKNEPQIATPPAVKK